MISIKTTRAIGMNRLTHATQHLNRLHHVLHRHSQRLKPQVITLPKYVINVFHVLNSFSNRLV